MRLLLACLLVAALVAGERERRGTSKFFCNFFHHPPFCLLIHAPSVAVGAYKGRIYKYKAYNSTITRTASKTLTTPLLRACV
jgi:hypothetical protein